jgi:hypothetical protein
MQASFRAARYLGVPLLLLCVSTAQSQSQTWFSLNEAGADSDELLLERALTQRGSVDFVQTRLQTAVETLRLDFRIPILLAAKKLEEASVSVDTPITKNITDLPLESILRLILADLELGIAIRDGVVLITTPEDIESQLITRVYPVLDLVTPPRLISQEVAAYSERDYDALIDLIIATIKPDSWDDVGGPGGINALDNAGALVISQSRDVHRAIENLLTSLRRVKAFQGIPSGALPTIASQRMTARPNAGESVRRFSAPAQAWQLPQVYSAKQ